MYCVASYISNNIIHTCMDAYLCRRNGYIYQYFELTQDLEGLLNITNDDAVIGGQCQDFFEFREVAMNSYI